MNAVDRIKDDGRLLDPAAVVEQLHDALHNPMELRTRTLVDAMILIARLMRERRTLS